MKNVLRDILPRLVRQRPLLIRWGILLAFLLVLLIQFRGIVPQLLKGDTASLSLIKSYPDRFETYGPLAPTAYVLFFMLANTIFFPQFLLACGAGLLFGIMTGSLVSLIGVIGSSIPFYLVGSRWGEKIFSWFGKEEAILFDRYLTPMDEYTVFHCRLSGWVPFHPVNVASGMYRLPLSSFLLGTFFGLLPRMMIYVFIGATLMQGGSWLEWAGLLWGTLVLFQAGYTYWFFHRRLSA